MLRTLGRFMPKRCELARRFVIGKLFNQRAMLQRYQRHKADTEMTQAIDQLADIVHNLATLPLDEAKSVRPLASGDNRIEGTPLETILGMEGAGSAVYFQCFGKLMSNQKQWPFARRIKRPPTDPVNSLLSFGYSLLTNQVASAVQLVGFDHFVGYLHSSFYGRPSLALDLMEEFRPIIVDSVVLFKGRLSPPFSKNLTQQINWQPYSDRSIVGIQRSGRNKP